MKQNLTIMGLFIFYLGINGTIAQEALTASGGEAQGNGGASSYSVGQVLYKTNTGGTGTVAQGVQQAYEISISVGMDETNINLTFYTYPNPTSDFLTIEFDGIPESDLSYVLYDMNGKQLESNSIKESITMINMKQYTTGSYFLQVHKRDQEIKAFKIIKNQ